MFSLLIVNWTNGSFDSMTSTLQLRVFPLNAFVIFTIFNSSQNGIRRSKSMLL